MAFTKNPVDKTQTTQRFNFVGGPEQRDFGATKDQRLVNWMPEKTEGPEKQNQQWWLRTRPGLDTLYTLGSGTPRGIYYWDVPSPGVLSVVGASVYINNTFLYTLSTSTGDVGFVEFVNDVGTRTLILVDGTYGYIFTANNTAPTVITDVDFPNPHIPTPIVIDGYLFLAKPNTQDVYNSDLNDPSSWTSGDFISAEMYPDTIQGLTRNNNYIYAVGTNSIELLYDAANASGSPLARHDSAVQQFGTPCIRTVVSTDTDVIMVGEMGRGGRSVWTIDGFKETEIAAPAIRFVLDQEGTNITNASAYCVKVAGQKLYVLNLTSRTFVYSLDSKLWFEWNFTYRPYDATDSNIGYPYVIVSAATNVVIATMTDLVAQDLGTAITCTITTSKLDFDTSDRKRMDLLVLLGDTPNTSGLSVQVQWSDDDYQTWSSATSLSLNPIFAGIFRLGMFRRRALKFTYTQPYLLRLEGMEITINKGQT